MTTNLLGPLFGAVLLASVVNAGPVPVLDVVQLTADADLIVTGTMTIDDKIGEIAIDQVLKGTAPSPVRALLPADGTVIGDGYRLFFLKARGSEYDFASPYYPSLPAVRDTRFTTADALGRVFETLGTVVRSNAPFELKHETIGLALMGVRHPIAQSALRDVLDQGDDRLRLLAAGALLAGDDVSALPFVEIVLLQTPPDSWANFLGGVQSGLRKVRNQAAIPMLTRLLARGNTDTRRAAADALRFMRSPATIDAFVAALDDTDVEVRHSAVLGLAETTGQLQWGPSIPAFAADPDRYISYWKEWARSR